MCSTAYFRRLPLDNLASGYCLKKLYSICLGETTKTGDKKDGLAVEDKSATVGTIKSVTTDWKLSQHMCRRSSQRWRELVCCINPEHVSFGKLEWEEVNSKRFICLAQKSVSKPIKHHRNQAHSCLVDLA